MLVDIFYYILQKAYRNGITIEVTEEDIIKDGFPCCGYFDFVEKKLAISTAYKTRDVMQTFVHESCHMDQWFEKSKILLDSEDSLDDFFAWLGGEDLGDDFDPYNAAKIIQNLELDCEIRTVKKFHEWGYKTPRNYIKRANAYILSYYWMATERRWLDFDYESKVILEKMPSVFMPLEWYSDPAWEVMIRFNQVGSFKR